MKLEKAIVRSKEGTGKELASGALSPTAPQVSLPPDMDLSLVAPEILTAVDTSPLGESQRMC